MGLGVAVIAALSLGGSFPMPSSNIQNFAPDVIISFAGNGDGNGLANALNALPNMAKYLYNTWWANLISANTQIRVSAQWEKCEMSQILFFRSYKWRPKSEIYHYASPSASHGNINFNIFADAAEAAELALSR